MRNLLIKIRNWLISFIPRENSGKVDRCLLGWYLSAVVLIVSLLVCAILEPHQKRVLLPSNQVLETSLKLGQETRILYIYDMDGTPKWFITRKK